MILLPAHRGPRVTGGRLATRNTRDFDGLGLVLVDPWTDETA